MVIYICYQQINNVNVENSTIDRAIDLIQSKKKLQLLVEKKALQEVVVGCQMSSFIVQFIVESDATSLFTVYHQNYKGLIGRLNPRIILVSC